MISAGIPFPPSANGMENIGDVRGGKRTRRNALMDATNDPSRPLQQSVTQKPPFACKSPPRITILTNPERTRTRSLSPAQETHPSPRVQASPPRITILTNPARARSLSSIQNTPLPSIPEVPSPPRITILTNPARKRPSPSAENSQNTPNATPAAPVPKRTPTSILKALAPSKLACSIRTPALGVKSAAEIAKGKLRQKAGPLPTIVVDEPLGWDVWIDVHRPRTSHGYFLDVPAVNGRGKMYMEDFARFFPNDYAAEQSMRRLRKMVRNGARKAAGRKEHARRRR